MASASLLFLAFFVALSASQISLSLQAGEVVPTSAITPENVFGNQVNLTFLGFKTIQFFNGIGPVSVNFEPFTPTGKFNDTIYELSALQQCGICVPRTWYSTAAFTVTANAPGAGVIGIQMDAARWQYAGTNTIMLSIPANEGDDAKVEYVPRASGIYNSTYTRGLTTLNFPVTFGRRYAMISFNWTTLTAGLNVETAWQVPFNYSTRTPYNGYTSWSEGQSTANTNTNSGAATSITGNPFVQVQSQSTGNFKVSTYRIGTKTAYGTITNPLGTNTNVGVQFQVNYVAQSSIFVGNLTYNSNGKKLNTFSPNAVNAASFSWYRALGSTASELGWTRVPSLASLDPSGNLIVSCQINQELVGTTEWAVAANISGANTKIFSFVALAIAFLLSF